ncbi:MAG: RNA ligase, partial [Desulfurococcales archaeon]|nr:RNA ligase [Desulfurococcales archaeon]
KLSERKREGLVLKDPYNRVDPLKYTTAYINVNDIRIGMEAPFDEGRHFLFPRILREAFRVLERGGGEEEIGETAKRLGLAILEPFINSIMNYLEHEKIIETFRLVFYEHEDLEEFMKYYLGLGVDVVPVSIERTSDGRIIVEAVKYKRDTMREYKRIFRTGLSPLD